MPDGHKTPPPGAPKAKTRAATEPGRERNRGGNYDDARDVDGFEARQLRERSPIPGTVRGAIDPGDDITGNYEGEALAKMREEARTLPQRVALLEVKADHVVQEIVGLRVVVGDARLESAASRARSEAVLDRVIVVQSDLAIVKGALEGQGAELGAQKSVLVAQNAVLATIAADAKRAADREHLTFTRQIEIEKAGELAEVDVERAEALANVDITRARELDAIKAKQLRRKTIAKAIGKGIGLVAGGGGVIELLHRMGVL